MFNLSKLAKRNIDVSNVRHEEEIFQGKAIILSLSGKSSSRGMLYCKNWDGDKIAQFGCREMLRKTLSLHLKFKSNLKLETRLRFSRK